MTVDGDDNLVPEPPPHDRPRPFGDYQLLRTLGVGGMGSIHLARRAPREGVARDVQGFCVVKKMRPELARQASFVRRFHDEARVVVTLNHPALCHVFDVGRVGDEHYLAMELVEGVTLRQLCDAAKRDSVAIDVDVALTIVDAVLDALAYAHDRSDPLSGATLRVVHRDVSPQNVMVGFEGAVKLIDFGLVSSTVKSEQTAGGFVLGKLSYMSPEQARGEAIDARTDVWATAIVAFELLSGRRFYGERSKGVIAAELNDGSYVADFSDIPEALRAPLRRALAPEVGDRTPSAAAFADDLARAHPGRRGPRAVRDLVTRLCAREQQQQQALLRTAAQLAVPARDERTAITHIATSTSSSSASSPASMPAESPPTAPLFDLAAEPTRILAEPAAPPAPRASFGVVVFAFVIAFAAVIGAWRVARGNEAVVVVDAGAASVVDAGSAEADAGFVVDAGTVVVDEEVSADDEEEPTKATAKKKRPPPLRQSDLGAQLDYLARWCVPRAACAKPLVASRSRIALLDAAGLTTLRADAARCVVTCRR